MTDEDMARVSALVPKRTHESAKNRLDHGGISREIRKTMERIAHGAETSERERIKDNLKDWREERRSLKQQRENINNEIDEIERKIERAENQLDDLRDKEGEYEGALQMIEEDMHEHGACVFEDHKKVQRAAMLGECSAEDVLADLKERNPELSANQFTTGGMK